MIRSRVSARRRRRAWTIALVLASLAAPRISAASPWSVRGPLAERAAPSLRPSAPERDDTDLAVRREAEAAFADGEAAFERGDYATASVRFARAQALSPHPWTLYNLALSQSRSGDALAAFHSFDALSHAATTDGERTEAARERDALLPLLATVELGGPVGSRACIDGVALVIVEDQRRRVLAPGVHRVTTMRSDDNLALAAGQRVHVDASAPRTRRDRRRAWAGLTIGGGVVAVGGGIAGAVLAERPVAQGLAGAAAVGGAVAVIAAAVRLAHDTRNPAAPAVLHCGDAPTEP
ncbi:MAG: hypothetical protein IPH07_07160 [Deltaproteobacteria bacterium]|nr:hypothetical protein [Deltaproteobacteria bacterium]MBK8236515.1 hypothetical protein [Deltaproteobacteria bacterium]MBK8717862.1 hypothetical protein [Deltaproteobacteria bacterium]MBP7287777.1 hypothetical protein [Nannocystaceae bacterium]